MERDSAEEIVEYLYVKDLSVGDVIEAFDGPWSNALVVETENGNTGFVTAKLWRPYMSLQGDKRRPITQYEIYTITGGPVRVIGGGEHD